MIILVLVDMIGCFIFELNFILVGVVVVVLGVLYFFYLFIKIK